jgi:DNA-binding LacI/PurR family transcriptional regulator
MWWVGEMSRSTVPGVDGTQRARSEGRRASMVDVARLAGVSAQTVSRVSSGYSGVLHETRGRVLAAMSELGYRPNSAARALKSGRFRTIGVIMSTLATTGNMRTLEAIVTAAVAEGQAITLLPPVAVPAHGRAPGSFSRLREEAVDGVIIVMEIHLLRRQVISIPPGVPIVVVDSDAGNEYAVVDSDQAAGAASAVQHLLDLGHRNVWHIAGPPESFAAQRRLDAWARVLREAGITPPPVFHGDWTAESGYKAGLQLATEDGCTAIFSANDSMALGVLRALNDAGLRVPADMSVVGFDDVPESSSFIPPLTTVHQDFAEVGRRCVEGVLRQVRGGSPERGTALVRTQLIVRQSTGAPAQRPGALQAHRSPTASR